MGRGGERVRRRGDRKKEKMGQMVLMKEKENRKVCGSIQGGCARGMGVLL